MSGPAPGFYGKAPSLGDFVSRNLPSGLVTMWDRCLADIVQFSRVILGGNWMVAWNEAPVWHFRFGAGLAGPVPWAGVLIPSVDRIGRQFPFSILGPAAAGGLEYGDWLLRVEALALAALEDDFDPAALALQLERLGPPSLDGLGELPSGGTAWSCRDTAQRLATSRAFTGLPADHDAAWLVAG